MKEKEYLELVRKVPKHHLNEFVDYVRDNNVKIYEDNDWIIVENLKYHEKGHPHYTAFAKVGKPNDLYEILNKLGLDDWFVYRNQRSDRTINRFHLHIVKDIRYYISKYFK